MITKIKLVVIALLVTALTSCLFVMNKMDEQLERRKERISFLEDMVKEQSRSFTKLQDSCFVTQQASEKNAEVTQEHKDKAEALKKEIAEIQEALDRAHLQRQNTTISGSNGFGDGGVARDNFGGKDGTETRDFASLNSKLDASVLRLLDKAYCEAEPTSIRCSAK